jgi:hypothetical protein
MMRLEINHMDECFLSFFLFCFSFGISFLDLYTSQQKKRYKHFFQIHYYVKPKQLLIIIYVNICVKRVYPHEAKNNILFRIGKIPESQFSVPWSSLRWSNYTFKSPAVINCAVSKENNLPFWKLEFSQERRCHGSVKMTASERWVWLRLEWFPRPLQNTLMCLE